MRPELAAYWQKSSDRGAVPPMRHGPAAVRPMPPDTAARPPSSSDRGAGRRMRHGPAAVRPMRRELAAGRRTSSGQVAAQQMRPESRGRATAGRPTQRLSMTVYRRVWRTCRPGCRGDRSLLNRKNQPPASASKLISTDWRSSTGWSDRETGVRIGPFGNPTPPSAHPLSSLNRSPKCPGLEMSRSPKCIEGHPRTGDPQWNDVRRRPTLPRGGPRSTIGAERLSFRVRNGTGRFPLAMTAVTLLRCQSNYRPYPGNCTVDA
jgi:hypothetical protein